MAPLVDTTTLPKANNPTPIQHYYAQTTIFITGGTGFLGRILVEKLLRSCPDLSKIYLLIRHKKGKTVEVRLNEMFNDEIFNKLKSEQTNFRNKVFGVFGDIAEINLGLSEEDRETLTVEANLVFHCAATVNFDEPLHNATKINIRGTRDLFRLCREMKNLKFVTHVSTAYTHCHHKPLGEKFYEIPYKPQMIIDLAENFSGITDKISETVLGNYPNTYAFTKSISEDIILENSDLPVAIFRPAIIVSTYKEPIPGWINNYYGPQGVTIGACMGLLRSLHCDGNVNSNIVPVDMCANAMIAVPWDNSNNKKKDVPIYHFDSNTYCPISWTRFRHLTYTYGIKHPPSTAIGYYFFHLRSSKISHNLAILFMHYLPALLFDTALICSGNKPKLMKAYEKVHKFSKVISYFCTQNWTYDSNNLGKLCDNLSPEDKKLFFCDLRRLDWDTFFQTYLLGCRFYLLKDSPDTIEFAKKRYNRLRTYSCIAIFIFACLVLTFMYYLFKLFSSIF